MESLRSFKDITVRLIGAIDRPYEVAVGSARTCYSGKGIIFPDDVSRDEKAVALRDRIALSTLEAGHLTTRQHAHFVFALSGVSRQFIWSFLHGHPFYNSEQVSQRYVRVKPDSFVAPHLPEREARLYREQVTALMTGYEALIEQLRPSIRAEYFGRFVGRSKAPEKWNNAVEKRVYEVARYVLPVCTTAYLYHTVSALTLLRYAKLCQLFDTPDEQRHVVDQMLTLVKQSDPLFEKELSDPVPLEQTLEFQVYQRFLSGQSEGTQTFIDDFDRRLEGRTSKLVSATQNAEAVLAEATRVSLGRSPSELSDADALELILDPKHNPMLADTLGASTMDRLMQLFHHVHFTFHKKISHTADSQDQRHRMVMSSRPLLRFHYSGRADYLTPFGIAAAPEAQATYEKLMDSTFRTINELIDAGVDPKHAYYLLPNSFPIRMVSTGDLLAYQHKWKMRSCYNAQEEIFRATVDEVTQVKNLFPRIGEHLRAPCYLRNRAGIKPFCPEGDHFCGVPVWKLGIEQYERKSL